MLPASSISDDARAIVLLCSSVAAAQGTSSKPLGPVGWAKLAAHLRDQGVAPADLLRLSGAGDGSLAAALEGTNHDPDEVRHLLERSPQLGFELERLASRGIAVLTIVDDAYPARLRRRLGASAPPVLFTAGDTGLLDAGGVAIVGSRDVDEEGVAFADALAAAAAAEGRVVVSGGARGVDQVAMAAAFGRGGCVAGLLPEGIERRLREPSIRSALADGQVALASPYNPSAPFSAGAAMGRNKLIYALADVAVVVSSAAETGGTWSGATEALKGGWVPVYVRTGPGVPAGNERLIALGARPLPSPEVPPPGDDAPRDSAKQQTLFE